MTASQHSGKQSQNPADPKHIDQKEIFYQNHEYAYSLTLSSTSQTHSINQHSCTSEKPMNNSQRVDSLWRIFQQIDNLMTSDEAEMYPVLDELKVFILDLCESDGFLIPGSRKDEPGSVVDFLKWLKK